jgi:ketosteroid isomerase-like protein
MSERSIALVKRLYEGLDSADIEAVVAAFDPSVELSTPTSLPWSTGHYSGLDGAVEYFTRALDYLEVTQFIVEEVRPSGDDWVAAIGRWTGTFRASKGEFDVPFVHFWTLRDGKVVKGAGISDTDGIVRAYEAAGA